ncbi:WD40-repeat-containing domain protein [Lanmaoa asiatica]|nr:WD40-repeat-containing domain protein [Lanmaoa asiatica]
MFNNASNIDASHSTFSEVHRDQYIYSRAHVQGDYTVNTIVHGNQVFQGTLGLENLHRASVPSAAFDSINRHPAPACLPDTRFELLACLAEWVDSPNCNQRICWLSGLAGSGKSAIAQSIANKYASQHRLAASFFFSRKEILRRKAQGFFPTLACQILTFAPSIRPALLDALNADATIPTKVLLEQARRLLHEPIVSSASSFPDPVLIVVDSLDECDDVKMANEIVHLLSGILRHCRWPLKVLFTSRAEPHIVQTFQHPELRSMTRSLQLQDFGVDEDIRAYLHHSFEGIRESMNATSVNNYPLPWPSEDEIEMIVQKAAGLFIFATTVVKYVGIDYGSPVTQLQAVLKVLQNGASAESALVHSPLDTLYLDALRTIPDAEKVHLILGSIVFAFRPLSTRGLNDLLWKFQYDASYIVKNLCSVLVISDSVIEGDGIVHVYHTSFRDFLTSSHRSRQYFVDPVVFHGTLARACLELMIRHLTVDMCHLGDPSILNCEIENLDKRRKLHIKEGVRYACRWFAHHLSQVPWDRTTDNALILSLQGFASQYLLNWIEVLSLTGELDSAVSSLREAADWLESSPKPYEETLSLFRDAERLVLMCYDSIQQAALQVYYSLPCVPTRVQIRTTYAHELKNKFMITHGLDDHWKLCLRSVSTGATIQSLAISASGRLIASAGETPGVQLWDTLTGSNTGHFRGDGTSTCPVVFSPSGDYIAIGYDTGAIDLWDVTTGQRLLDPSQSPHNASVTVLAFSQNSLFIASGAADATVHVWDISTRSLKHSVAYHEGSILCLLFSSSNDLIASGSDDTSIITSEMHSQRVRIFHGHTSKVSSISFSPDNGRIASGSDDQTVRLWDTRTGVCLRTFSGMHKKPIRQVWITADNKYIVSVCNMDIYMWETSSPNRKSPQHIWSVNHYYRKMATKFPAWYAKLARLVPAGLVGRLAGTDDGTVLHTAPSPDGKTMVCAYGSSLLLLEHFGPQKSWSKVRHPLGKPSTLDEPPLFADDSNDIFTAVAMTLDTTLLVTSVDNGIIKIWNTSSRSNWKTFQGTFKKTAEGFWPAPDGHSLLVKPMVGLRLITLAGTLIKDLETGGDTLGNVGAVSSPDSRYFAYWAEYTWNVDQSFSIHIYNASTGVRLERIPGFFKITCGRFSAESDLFACAHGDGVVQVWELQPVLRKTTIMTGHAAITALEFLPGSITLVVGSDMGCVEIRLVENGDVVHRIECHEDDSIFVWDPSYSNIVPHCLSPKVSKETSDGAVSEPDGVDFIKFTEGYRSICTRSLKGVICTWDLTRCLSKYAEQAKETLVDNAATNTITTDISTQPSDLPSSDPSDGSASLTMLSNFGAQDDTVVSTDSTPLESASLVPQNEVSKPEPTAPQNTIEELTTPDTPTTPPTSSLSCPHLVSRSDSHIVYDRYFRSTYSVDGREGWVYRGSRRMFWLPSDLRPASPIALSAFEDRLVIVTRSRPIVFFDLRPMVDSTPTRRAERTGQ